MSWPRTIRNYNKKKSNQGLLFLRYYCKNCSDLLCDTCNDAHRVVKYTKDHSVSKLSSSSDLSKLVKKKYHCIQVWKIGRLLRQSCFSREESWEKGNRPFVDRCWGEGRGVKGFPGSYFLAWTFIEFLIVSSSVANPASWKYDNWMKKKKKKVMEKMQQAATVQRGVSIFHRTGVDRARRHYFSALSAAVSSRHRAREFRWH